jgi:hypothetical protein
MAALAYRATSPDLPLHSPAVVAAAHGTALKEKLQEQAAAVAAARDPTPELQAPQLPTAEAVAAALAPMERVEAADQAS